MPYLLNAVAFLIQTVFDFLIGVFLVRVMLIVVGCTVIQFRFIERKVQYV